MSEATQALRRKQYDERKAAQKNAKPDAKAAEPIEAEKPAPKKKGKAKK
jgi:hypothetical protein